MKIGCRNIETTAIEVFARHSWRFSNRIALQMSSLEAFPSFSLVQNFVFEIVWTAVVVFVIRNSYTHWSMQKLGYSYILFSKNKVQIQIQIKRRERKKQKNNLQKEIRVKKTCLENARCGCALLGRQTPTWAMARPPHGPFRVPSTVPPAARLRSVILSPTNPPLPSYARCAGLRRSLRQ